MSRAAFNQRSKNRCTLRRQKSNNPTRGWKKKYLPPFSLHELAIRNCIECANLKTHIRTSERRGSNTRDADSRSFRVKQKAEGWFRLKHAMLLHLSECTATRYNREYPRRNAHTRGSSYSARHGHTFLHQSLDIIWLINIYPGYLTSIEILFPGFVSLSVVANNTLHFDAAVDRTQLGERSPRYVCTEWQEIRGF